MIEKEVTEFVIVPPYVEQHSILAAKERLEHYLSQRFPGYTFRLAKFAPVGDEDDFCVVPIMGFIGDDGDMRMCVEPKRWLVGEIMEACREFDTGSRAHCAA